jgi:small GTP-binding protein
MSQEFKYDVFLSHSSKDKETVRELAERLKADGVRVWLDDWIIKPGDAIGIKINKGLEESRVLVAVMSVNASESDWTTFEQQSILFNDPTNKTRRFIPLRLDDSEIQFALRQFAYIDWRNRDELEYERLLSVARENVKTQLPESKGSKTQKIEAVRILEGHDNQVNSVAISSDDKFIVSSSSDNTVRIWEVETGECLKVLEGHSTLVSRVVISSDDKLIVSSSNDETVRIWEVETGECLKVLEGHSDIIWGLAISSDNKFIVSGSNDKTVRIWEVETGECLKVLEGHSKYAIGVAISSDDKFIVSGSDDKTVRIWEVETGKCLKVLEGHSGFVLRVAISSDNKFIVSVAFDNTVQIWEVETGKCLKVLEGHSSHAWGLAISSDDKFIVSGSNDKTVRIWEVETGECLKVLEGHPEYVLGVAISSDGKFIVSCSADATMRIWDISSLAETLKQSPVQKSGANNEKYKFYTNAKVLLVGDSGVGKSGLAHRLTQDKFVETISTDGVWATQMSLPHSANTEDTEREIWLWDFAGQSDYRLIHQLFMDETSLAVLVFNPQADNPFEGLGQWDRDLQKAARRPFKKLLVAGRCDRGSLTVSDKSLTDFKNKRQFANYLETSALTGAGCDDLRQAIIEHINWDEIPYRSSPRIFKLLKEEILKLKDEGRVLLTLSELKQNLELRLSDEEFTFDEFKTVVGLLAGSGVVWQLEFGDFVLLQPERINSYAAAVVRSVRKHVDEIGCIAEEKVLEGELDYQDMKRLPKNEEEIVLRAMLQVFVKHGLCLREKTDEGRMLVFPSYFKRERPELDEHPSALITYQFNGMLDEIYATLIVRLHYTTPFEKDQLWRYAADFKTETKKRIGLKMTKKAEGAAEITIYLDREIPDEIKVLFIRYVHDHLKTKDENVVRVRHYICPNFDCGEPVESQRAVDRAIEKKAEEIPCQYCFNPIPLKDLIEEKFASDLLGQKVHKEEETALKEIDNESRELILVGDAYAVVGRAGQIFRQTSNSDWGIDGEIEFKDYEGKASGKRVYLQLKSGDSYLRTRKRDEKEIFDVKPRHAEYWQAHNYDVMLVIRTSDDEIRWMNATEYLKKHGKDTRQIIFDGEPFSALNVVRLRDKILGQK